MLYGKTNKSCVAGVKLSCIALSIASNFYCARWHAVASWTWDAQDETCGICRMAFDGCCPDCKLPGDDCPLIWGACNHAFHLHCILKWVNSQTSQAHCPMCRREWQFKG
ncbi:Anaphase-promoting complex subunit 11 [Spatholobus suberectus]|nr:Anaphase-promoting complex subunit 11 [Spatholobus suberectus]